MGLRYSSSKGEPQHHLKRKFTLTVLKWTIISWIYTINLFRYILTPYLVRFLGSHILKGHLSLRSTRCASNVMSIPAA